MCYVGWEREEPLPFSISVPFKVMAGDKNPTFKKNGKL